MRLGIKVVRIQLCSLLRLVEEGEQIVITRHGVAVARIRKVGPVTPAKPPELIEQIFRASDKFEKELAKMFRSTGGNHGKND